MQELRVHCHFYALCGLWGLCFENDGFLPRTWTSCKALYYYGNGGEYCDMVLGLLSEFYGDGFYDWDWRRWGRERGGVRKW